ncbi:hypothetical protein P170DRAFT_450932 [Aspergillus steynii IBT 23096]|uniref:Mannosyltransferase putative-domain-containing protein n=1 Tax=Aspergillus steynii IBT 23096 TaxID=1392250 RepID=A0A2I2FT06_9EURO|nr:uncharacterized protein P170DRAFT_450932 [Aspergillus steynii IBT 23096]PLB43759.1 hypothetical protein P170DRAFT_450932 [Aspergillus steynii IBT 23096]
MPVIDSDLIRDVSQYFIDYPIEKPYDKKFGELGRRCRVLRDWLTYAEKADPTTRDVLLAAVERVALSTFPYLQNPSIQPPSERPISDLRSSFEPGSAGIVVPTSDKTLRFAAHLIGSIRSVLGSNLPIQVVYAGDADLGPQSRDYLSSLAEQGPPIEFLNIMAVFDDSTLQLQSGGWAIKAFAALASRFESVVLVDADAVFFQPPEVLLEHDAFLRSGSLLFHDRLLWKHRFADRHEWWRDQIRRPSPAMNVSRVWTEDYAEEGDSGLVVMDKSRVDVLVGLLHVCWQNTHAVREEVTYRITHGDKESWWMGMELAGAGYEFSSHYGGIVGWTDMDGDRPRVCSFVIAHVDAKDQLLWWNGSLLKNKGVPEMTKVYDIPTNWMIDAEWLKGDTKQDMSCMIGGEVRNLTNDQTHTLERSVELAKRVDATLLPPEGMDIV